MTMMRIVPVLMAALVASLLEQTQAAPLPKEKLLACLKVVDTKLTTIQVPEELIKLAEGLRSLNPLLKDLSLSKMIDDDSVVLDAVRAGIVQANQVDSMVHKCANYVNGLMTLLGDTDCGEELLFKTNEDFEGIMKGYTKLDDMIGYAKACTAAL